MAMSFFSISFFFYIYFILFFFFFACVRLLCAIVDLKQQYMIDYNIPCEVFMSDNLCSHYIGIVCVCVCVGRRETVERMAWDFAYFHIFIITKCAIAIIHSLWPIIACCENVKRHSFHLDSLFFVWLPLRRKWTNVEIEYSCRKSLFCH